MLQTEAFALLVLAHDEATEDAMGIPASKYSSRIMVTKPWYQLRKTLPSDNSARSAATTRPRCRASSSWFDGHREELFGRGVGIVTARGDRVGKPVQIGVTPQQRLS
jgi:hypothetical protein